MIEPTGPLSGARGGHAYFPQKVAQKLKSAKKVA